MILRVGYSKRFKPGCAVYLNMRKPIVDTFVVLAVINNLQEETDEQVQNPGMYVVSLIQLLAKLVEQRTDGSLLQWPPRNYHNLVHTTLKVAIELIVGEKPKKGKAHSLVLELYRDSSKTVMLSFMAEHPKMQPYQRKKSSKPSPMILCASTILDTKAKNKPECIDSNGKGHSNSNKSKKTKTTSKVKTKPAPDPLTTKEDKQEANSSRSNSNSDNNDMNGVSS